MFDKILKYIVILFLVSFGVVHLLYYSKVEKFLFGQSWIVYVPCFVYLYRDKIREGRWW